MSQGATNKSLSSDAIRVQGVHKSFLGPTNTRTHVLKDINFSVSAGEFLVIRGPNGCGKTTLMNLIGGLDEPTSGTIHIHGQEPREVPVGHLFQDYSGSLLPWMTLGQNAALPLRLKGIGRPERKQALSELTTRTGLNHLPFDRYPYQSSGGQQQKVCLLRAIFASDSLMILDEPFSALDRNSRDRVIEWLQRTRLARFATVLLVAHDLDDAILLADRVLCLDGTPASIRDIVPVDLPWPRGPSIRVEREFLELRSRILDSFGELRR